MAKRGVAFGASLSALIAAILPASAQTPAAAPEEEADVVITGSFIRGTPEDAALPVDVVTLKELENRGSPTVVQLIKTIPSSGAVIGENNRFGAGNGTATINLRNLNSASTGPRTLVLFNGKRVAGSTRSLGSVDLNMLPSNVVGRVEVLKDGAAATYGSDAIAGVVNFITRRDIRGFEVAGQNQFIDGSDGDYNGSLAYGFGTDNADGLISIGFASRSELPIAERPWALRTGDAGFLQNPLGGWAATGNPGLYLAPNAAPVGSPDTGFTSFNTSLSLPDIGCAANGGSPRSQLNPGAVSPTSCAFQYTVFDNLVENEDRLQMFGQLNVDLSDTLKFNAEALWSHNETPLQSWAMTGPNQWPAPILASGGSAGGGVSPISVTSLTGEQSNFYIPGSHPGLQQLIAQIGASSCAGPIYPWGIDNATCTAGRNFAVAAAANAGSYGVVTSTTSWRPIGFAGNPYTSDRHSHYTYKTDTWRMNGGFKGKLPGDIDWDLNLNFQQLDFAYNLQDTSVNRLQLALRGFGSRAGAADQCTPAEAAVPANAGNAAVGCYYFNPFANGFATSLSGNTPNPYYVATNGGITGYNDMQANRASVVDWFEEEQYNKMSERLFEANFVVTGELPINIADGDNISWAAGVQGRYDSTVQNPDALYDANATPCVDSPPFGDGAPFCPTTSNGAFLFNASLRPYDVNRTIYSGFAEVRLPLGEKLEVTGAARYEQYQGFGDTFNPKIAARWQATDWLALRASASTTYRAPRATFLTNTFTRGLTNASGTYKANDLYGNANLEAEEAVTYSTGVLFDNDRIRASVDYWHFDFKNPMTTEAATDLVSRMFPTADGDTRCGNPTVAALQARFTFAGGVCGKANIIGYRTNYINGGGVKTSGLDFQAEADLFEIAGGQLTAGFDGTYLLTYDESTTPIEGIYGNTTKVGPVINPGTASTDDRVGTFRASLFTGYNQTRGNAFLNYSVGDHNIRWQTRYISGLVQTENSPKALAAALGKNPDIAEYFQHDVTYRLNIPQFDAQLSASVQNVFDEEPPFAFGTQYNYDPGSGSPLGRIISVGLKKKF